MSRPRPDPGPRVFGKGSVPLSPELKQRIERQRQLEQRSASGHARPAPAPKSKAPAPEEERPLLPLLLATVIMVTLAAVLVWKVFLP